MEYKYWSNQDLALIKKDFENEIAKDIATGRNWQMRVYWSPSGWSSDAVLQNKIIEMVENGQLPNVFRDIKARTGGTSSTPLSRETYLRSRIKTI